jgi:hypothetical protein
MEPDQYRSIFENATGGIKGEGMNIVGQDAFGGTETIRQHGRQEEFGAGRLRACGRSDRPTGRKLGSETSAR